MRRALLTAAKATPVTVGDVATSPATTTISGIVVNMVASGLRASGTGILTRFWISVPSAVTPTIAFFTISPISLVVTGVTDTINPALVSGVNELTVAPIPVNVGDTLGIWGSLNVNSAFDADVLRSSSVPAKPTAGATVPGSLSTLSGRRLLLAAASS